jgi:TolB-like protein
MSDVFISYARSTAKEAQAVAEALRGLGYSVWIDDDLPAHRTYGRVIEEEMAAAKAAVVIWSADAVQSEWVLSEANRAREDRKLVQVITDKTRLPMPFDTIQCADLAGWSGDPEAPGWRKVAASVADLVGGAPAPAGAVASAMDAPLPLPSKPSIAVLPFANLSGDPEQEYFSDGMVEEIIAALSRIRSIFVIGGGSSQSFKGKDISPQDAARQLGVRYILEGSVRKAGGRVRIAVKLTDAIDGAQIWADRFEDTLEDVFALQDRVALAVAGTIEPTVLRMEMRRASRRPTDNLGSYDLYLRAWTLILGNATPEVRTALELLERAIALDPTYGHALGFAAIGYGLICGDTASAESATPRRLCIDLAHRALRAADDDALVVTFAAGALCMAGSDIETSLGLIERAIALNPGSCLAWHWSGVIRTIAGDADRAFEDTQTSMRLDPLSPLRGDQMCSLGLARFAQARFDEALPFFIQGVQLLPAWPYGHYYLAACYAHLGQTVQARASLARVRSLSNKPIDELASAWFRRPEHQRMLLDGVAIAEGGLQ